jgi:hypothetical protein
MMLGEMAKRLKRTLAPAKPLKLEKPKAVIRPKSWQNGKVNGRTDY